jgi:acetyl esterase/lipase
MLVQVGADETLLSDSTMLADRAEAAGVEVDLDVAEGMWHVYQFLAPMLPESRTALDRAAAFILGRTAMESQPDPTAVG